MITIVFPGSVQRVFIIYVHFEMFLLTVNTAQEIIIISRGHKANFDWQLPFIDSIDDLEYNKRLFDNCRPTRYFVKF